MIKKILRKLIVISVKMCMFLSQRTLAKNIEFMKNFGFSVGLQTNDDR